MATDLVHPIRTALIPVLSVGTWSEIRKDHGRVGLDWREDLQPGSGKPRYVERVLLALDDVPVIELARRCVDTFPERAGITVQNALWHHESGGRRDLSQITRRVLADWFDGKRLHPDDEPTAFMGRFALPRVLVTVSYAPDGRLLQRGTPVFGFFGFGGGGGAAAERPAAPIAHRDFLEMYDFNSWPDMRVFQLLEALIHPTVRHGTEQLDWLSALNAIIAVDEFQLRETARISDRPIFSVGRQRGTIHRRPKNLIFASNGPKPELGFSDALDNDVVILSNAEHCLVFEDAIGDDGLTWPTLVAWWARSQGLDDATAKKALGQRLLASMGSPVERQFFATYFKLFAPTLARRLPALLPQVYLHYDPATLRQLRARGLERRFLVQRMDFLMLLPAGVRVVVEIDGQQHYATSTERNAKPSPRAYADTVRSDRELRLAGYEVYRFGGAELADEAAAATVSTFFNALFMRHPFGKT